MPERGRWRAASLARVSASNPVRLGRRSYLLIPALLLTGVLVTALAGDRGLVYEAAHGTWQPVPGGYFDLQPLGSYDSLPNDSRAARMVHQSEWEIRPENRKYNMTTPPPLNLPEKDPAMKAYDPKWNSYVLARISGDYKGTTDEIFQWAAAKWGVPDDVIRTMAVMESDWHQSNAGDYVSDPSFCPKGYVALPCPVTFGIVGVKTTSWPGVFPWNRDSTATAVDVMGGWLRGCYEGWVWWLRDHGNTSRGVYAAGDLWGCVGAWYSGDWHDGRPGVPSGQDYINRAKKWHDIKPWLQPGYWFLDAS